MTDDPQLLQQLRQRSPEAFQRLFQQYSDKVYRLAVSIVQNEDDAEDVVQEVFIRFFEYLDRFEGRSKIGTWLYRVAYNASIDRVRKQRVLPVVDEDISEMPLPKQIHAWSDSHRMTMDQIDLVGQLEAAIRTLPESLRMVFLLRDVEELSTQDTAAVLNITPGAVKVRLHRARLQLREILTGTFAETGQRNE